MFFRTKKCLGGNRGSPLTLLAPRSNRQFGCLPWPRDNKISVHLFWQFGAQKVINDPIMQAELLDCIAMHA
jgi:hypothetical protein